MLNLSGQQTAEDTKLSVVQLVDHLAEVDTVRRSAILATCGMASRTELHAFALIAVEGQHTVTCVAAGGIHRRGPWNDGIVSTKRNVHNVGCHGLSIP